MSTIYRKILYTVLLIFCATPLASGKPLDDARRLYKEGRFEEAIEILRPMVKKTPRDGNVTYYLGASLYSIGNYEEAAPYLRTAVGRGVADASRMLAGISLDAYAVDEASEHLDEWEAAVKKKKRNAEMPQEYDSLVSSVVKMRNMLDRTERIVILDSLSVDSADFFKFYRLSREAGSLLPPEVLKNTSASRPQMVYVPENRSYLMWAAPDTTGLYAIYRSYSLDDGTLESPEKLELSAGDDVSVAYPFMMPDGMTLYFAAEGENSLGGYDIFMTRDDGEGGFLQPQNVGMPYNSPANDYMLVIDESAGLGWWATDRNAPAGKVTIYVYIPSETRVNVSPDDENLVSLARLDDISLTRPDDKDYKALLQSRLPESAGNGTSAASGAAERMFMLDMGDGRIYTRTEDFKNRDARKVMIDCLAAISELRRLDETLEQLRLRYPSDKSVAPQILEGEQTQRTLRQKIAGLRNKAVSLEKKVK